MYKIQGNKITLTRGDSFYCQLTLKSKDGTVYVPEEGDVIRFAMGRDYGDPIITKVIPNDTMTLSLVPADTEELSFGKYVYDIEITFADGDVDTFINEAEFVIAPEVS